MITRRVVAEVPDVNLCTSNSSSNTPDAAVGCNDELLFAYEDAASGVLELELRVQRLTKKRSIDQLSDHDTEEQQVSITSTQWKNSEIALFEAGVRLYGWGKWTRIQQEVKTRSVDAVRHFARTSKGLRLKCLTLDLRIFLSCRPL
jgi:hypothetical protein